MEAAENALKALQKDVDDRRRELLSLKKEAEADKKDAEEKNAETRESLKKIERALQGAALELKNKNPNVRIKTAKGLAKLAGLPGVKEYVGEALVEAMMDSVAEVKTAASEALEKIDPVVYPHVLTLVVGTNKFGAVYELRQLGTKAKSAVPILLHYHNAGLTTQAGSGSISLEPLAQIAPADKRVAQILLNEIGRIKQPTEATEMVYGRRFHAIKLIGVVKLDPKDAVRALLAAFNDGERTLNERDGGSVLAVMIIEAIETLGSDGTADAIPLLRKLKSSPVDSVRQAATKALVKIEASK